MFSLVNIPSSGERERQNHQFKVDNEYTYAYIRTDRSVNTGTVFVKITLQKGTTTGQSKFQSTNAI